MESAGYTQRYFRKQLMRWAQDRGRQLPWRLTNDPYKVLLAEVLLQKTSVSQAIPVYQQLVVQYPSVSSLAAANVRSLRATVAPVGLPSRGNRLKSAARRVVKEFAGRIPLETNQLRSLSGVGPYVAAAVSCFAYGQPVPMVDSNVLRVFERFFGLKSSSSRPRNDRAVWRFAEQVVPSTEPWRYNQALLDFGALVCIHRQPKCQECPVKRQCRFYNRSEDA